MKDCDNLNIFQFLGLPVNHRSESKVVQLVRHFDEVNPKAEQGVYHKEVKFPMFAQVKKDGIFSALVIRADDTAAIFGRTGKKLTNVSKLEGYFSYLAASGSIDSGVYLGELCSNAKCSLEELSGIVNPNRTKDLTLEQTLVADRIDIHFFDEVTISEFKSGVSERKFSERYESLIVEMTGNGTVLPCSVVNTEDELRDFAKSAIKSGEEGVVAKQDVNWIAGAKDWHQMKIVRSVSYDLLCIGYEEGTGKYSGKVANLLFRFKDNKVVKAMLGKGWTHNDAEFMFDCIKRVESKGVTLGAEAHIPTGRIYKVYGLQPSSKNGVIRLPKVGEQRFDKSEPDY